MEISVENASQKQATDANLLSEGAKIFGYFPRIGSGLISLAIFGYVIGWLNAKAYYNQFGATWLINDLTTLELLSFSTTTFTFLGVMLFNFIINLLEGPPKVMVSKWVYVSCAILSILGPIISKVFIGKGMYSLAMSASTVAALACAHIAVILFYRSVEFIAKSNDHKNFGFILPLVIAMFFGLYSIPTTLGEADGKRDSSKASNLPEVLTKDQKVENLRLLRAKGDIYYATNLVDQGVPQQVYIINKEEIMAVRAHNAKIQKQPQDTTPK